jgi:hypothetical protein
VEKLNQILSNECVLNGRVNQIRGVHPCNICGAHKFSSALIGSCKLWIPSHNVGIVLAAPSPVIHYIQEHNYCPTQDFVESVLRVEMSEVFNGQELYDDLVRGRSSEV